MRQIVMGLCCDRAPSPFVLAVGWVGHLFPPTSRHPPFAGVETVAATGLARIHALSPTTHSRAKPTAAAATLCAIGRSNALVHGVACV